MLNIKSLRHLEQVRNGSIFFPSPTIYCCLRFCTTSQSKTSSSSSPQVKVAVDDDDNPEQTLKRCRKDTDREFYEPGPLARALRRVVVASTQFLGLRKTVAAHMERGLSEVAKMEDEAKWLRAHGSPLRVLGLPDSADLDDVKSRYRNLLFEVHPDTSPRDDKRALAKLGLNDDQIRARQQSEFELLKTAFKIATTPASLWHQDGNAPALLRELQPNLTLFDRVVNAQTLFPIAAYLYGFCVLFVIFSLAAKILLDVMLHATDPEFYDFMYHQEAEERRKREAGEEVDYNPKRLAPTKFRRISSPGLYVNRFVPSEDDFWQDD